MSAKQVTPASTGGDRGYTERIQRLYRGGLTAARESYDAERHLVWAGSTSSSEGRTFRPPVSLVCARALLRQGDAESVAEALSIVGAALDSQELSPDHPHRGNFLWLADDAEVADLNAVQFMLRQLLPILVWHDKLLPDDLLARCRTAVALALEEEERLDVAPSYTNIHLQSLLALLIGGQWLQDERFLELGKERWARFVSYTIRSGAPHEYNSPAYGGIDLATLADLYTLTDDPLVELQARILYERLWLHLLLHLHRPTGQLAGPHCRCYWPQMQSGLGPVKDLLWRETGWDWLLPPESDGPAGLGSSVDHLDLALTNHWLPPFVEPWLESQERVFPYQVCELANAKMGSDITTHMTANYALGTASRTYEIGTDCFYIEHQANYLLLHYRKPEQPTGWAMMYTRYVVNDRHWGTLGAAPDRPKTFNFYDQGHFAGLQWRNKAIGLYALMPQQEEVSSLKTVIVFQSGESLEGVFVNGERVHLEQLPLSVQPGEWVIVEDGGVYVGLFPLEPSCLGREAPILLERGPLGELWLTTYNYKGPAKRFWDYASLKGPFWQGNLKAGYVVEVADRDEFPSADAFLAYLLSSEIKDTVNEELIRNVSYRSGGDEIQIDYDLWFTEPAGRWINGEPYVAPNLDSPLAAQGDGGILRVGSATLTTNPQQIWLIAQEIDPKHRTWIAVNPEDRPTPLRLQTPLGELSVDELGLGRIEWQAPVGGEQKIVIDALADLVGLVAPEGVSIERSGMQG